MTGGQQDNTEGQTKEGSHEPTSPISMSGSERRPSFAEYNENPAPQLVSIDAGVANNENATQGNDADNASSVTLPLVLSLVEPDIGDRRGPAVVYAERERSWIAKHKMWVIIGLVLAVFVTIAVTVAVWEVEQKRNSKTAQGESVGAGASTSTTQASPSPTGPMATGTSTMGATTTTSSTGSASSIPDACTDTSHFLTKVSWMGIADATGGWSVSYASTSDATSCCTKCYQSTPIGCDSWAWMPDDTSGSTITACNIIQGWNGTDADDTCPAGYTSVHFSQSSTNASHVGAAGPCGSVASS